MCIRDRNAHGNLIGSTVDASELRARRKQAITRLSAPAQCRAGFSEYCGGVPGKRSSATRRVVSVLIVLLDDPVHSTSHVVAERLIAGVELCDPVFERTFQGVMGLCPIEDVVTMSILFHDRVSRDSPFNKPSMACLRMVDQAVSDKSSKAVTLRLSPSESRTCEDIAVHVSLSCARDGPAIEEPPHGFPRSERGHGLKMTPDRGC